MKSIQHRRIGIRRGSRCERQRAHRGKRRDHRRQPARVPRTLSIVSSSVSRCGHGGSATPGLTAWERADHLPQRQTAKSWRLSDAARADSAVQWAFATRVRLMSDPAGASADLHARTRASLPATRPPSRSPRARRGGAGHRMCARARGRDQAPNVANVPTGWGVVQAGRARAGGDLGRGGVVVHPPSGFRQREPQLPKSGSTSPSPT